MSRSRVLLLLFVGLLLAVWYAWQATPRQQRVGPIQKSGKVHTAISDQARDPYQLPELDFAGREKGAFAEPKRDLFRPLFRAPVIVKPPEPPEPPPSPQMVVKPPPPPPPPKVTQSVAKQTVGVKPIPPLVVLGFLQKAKETTVFLSSAKGNLYLVKKGERFADGLLLREVNNKKIVISRGMDDKGLTLAVSEMKVQRMSVPNVPSGRPSAPAYEPSAPEPGAPQ